MIPEVEERITNLKNKIITLKTDLKTAERELLKAYEDRFPVGRFYLLRNMPYRYRRLTPQEQKETKITYEIYWQKNKKNLGMTTLKSPYHEQQVNGYPGLYYARAYGRPRGTKTTQYDCLEKMLLAAQKFRFPINLLEAFVVKYAEIKEKENVAG